MVPSKNEGVEEVGVVRLSGHKYFIDDGHSSDSAKHADNKRQADFQGEFFGGWHDFCLFLWDGAYWEISSTDTAPGYHLGPG